MRNFFKTRRAAATARGPLRDVYTEPRRGWLAVDVETTGLDPRTDHLLSIGWVAVDEVPGTNALEVNLAVSGYVVIRPDSATTTAVGQSATVHGLTDDVVAEGVSAQEGVEKLLADLAGRTLLAHYAQMELGFLSPLCQKYFGAPLVVPVADTMVREYERVIASGAEPRRDQLRLWSLCESYGLPTMTAHHAFNDALSCAQLWIAQQAWGGLARPNV